MMGRFFLLITLFCAISCSMNQTLKVSEEKLKCFYLSKKVNSELDKSSLMSVFEIIDEDSIIHSIKPLGEVFIEKVNYTILTDFKKIPVANGYHGQSILIALSDESCVYYRFELPNELPIKLYEDTLYFENEKYSNSTHRLSELKKIVCFPPGCYEQQNCCSTLNE